MTKEQMLRNFLTNQIGAWQQEFDQACEDSRAEGADVEYTVVRARRARSYKMAYETVLEQMDKLGI